jgi:probable F420-dependent oxidoreductase
MATTSELRDRIGRVGAWVGTFTLAPAAEARPAAAEIDRLGYGALWYPEGLGTRESFSNGAILLGATERITVASGITNIWGRDPVASASAARVLGDGFGDRFLLGLGVSHQRQVDPRGHVYGKPVATMRAYLDAMDDDPFVSPDHGSPEPRPAVSRVLAALRPPMLQLAAERAQGAHTYLVPVEHTRRAREIMGPDALLIVEQKVVLDADAAEAHRRARQAIAWYLDTPNYRKNLEWLGFDETDLDGGGSDRLVEALVARGGEDAIRARVQEQLAAGADQVAIQPLGADDDPFGLDVLRRLAPALLDL